MGLIKNVAGQLIPIYAYDRANSIPKTGDAANITAQISLDGAATAATNDTNPTELDATDAPGVYIFTLTQAETNAKLVILSAVSATADIDIDPIFLFTDEARQTWTAPEVAAVIAGSAITVYRGTTWNITLTGLGDITAYETVYFSIKKSENAGEDDALLRVKNGVNGLERFNRESPSDAGNGSLTIVDAGTGEIDIAVEAAETQNAVPGSGLFWDVKVVDTDTEEVTIISTGTLTISPDITRAIT